jgi:hypothetical protein
MEDQVLPGNSAKVPDTVGKAIFYQADAIIIGTDIFCIFHTIWLPYATTYNGLILFG